MAEWNGGDHPRDDAGKFSGSGGSVKGALATNRVKPVIKTLNAPPRVRAKY